MKNTILTLLLFISSASLADNIQIGDLYYKFSGTNAIVSYKREGTYSDSWGKCYQNESYTIPSEVTYEGLKYEVTSIDDRAFGAISPEINGSSLYYVHLPNSIKTIGYNAFYNCKKLVKVTIPSSVTSMSTSSSGYSGNTFYGCTNLRQLIYTSSTAPEGWVATSMTYVPSLSSYTSPSYSINNANIIEMITWEKSSFVYTGSSPNLPTYTCNIPNYQVSFESPILKKDVGTWTIDIEMTFTSEEETFVAYIPFKYSITEAPLSITVKDVERKYGEENPNFSIEYTGFVDGENVNNLESLPVLKTSATQYSNVGTYSIDISGAKSDNYSITYKSGTLTINKAPLTAKVIDSSKEYGASNPNFSLEYEGLKNAETTPTWTISPSYTTSATNYSSVGEYEVSATATPRNYELSEIQSGKLTITPAPLTIQANNVSKVYYAENPDLTYSCYGLKNREDKSILSVQPQLTTNATKESEVGSYDITISGASAQNYNITYQNGKMTIQKRTLNVTVGNYERNYGEENPDFSIEYDGFVGSDDLSVIDTEPYPYTSATKDTKVGSYSIYITGGSDNNYSFNYNSGKLTINKAEQDIIWNQDLTNLAIGEQVKLLAESTSGLQITYSLDQNSICEIYDAGKTTYLDCKAEGEIQIRAYQEGNDNFYSTPRTSKKIIVSASTEVKPSLTIKQPDLGAISTKVVRGSTYEFTITPEEEWLVHTVSFNGNDYTSKLDKTNTFTTPQITSNSIIIIVYSQSANGIEDISSSNVKIIGTQNGVKVIGAKQGSAVLIYTIDGVLIESEEITSSSQEIKLDNNKLYIIKIGEFTSKVRL